MEKVILFGGSFDPIHNGHLLIAKAALKAINADKVIFIPARNPRWKETPSNEEDRLQMLELALKNYPKFEVSTIELESQEGGVYTIDTIKKILQNDAKNDVKNEYYYLIGEDHLEKLDQWHDIDTLATLVHFLAYDRNQQEWSPVSKNNADKYHVTIIEGPRREVSSTDIRNLKSIDVPESVLEYIAGYHLYRYQEIYDLVGKKRYAHSASVALLALNIAKNNKFNEYKAFIAGILHDVGKNLDKTEEGLRIMKEQWNEQIGLPLVTYHQFIGATLAKERFNIDDEEIIDAIAYHCTGKAKMTRLGELIYASDKIEPLRGYDSSSYIKACFMDMKAGFIVVLKANLEFLKEKGKDIHNPLSDACFKWYLGGF